MRAGKCRGTKKFFSQTPLWLQLSLESPRGVNWQLQGALRPPVSSIFLGSCLRSASHLQLSRVDNVQLG